MEDTISKLVRLTVLRRINLELVKNIATFTSAREEGSKCFEYSSTAKRRYTSKFAHEEFFGTCHDQSRTVSSYMLAISLELPDLQNIAHTYNAVPNMLGY
jgi:hypothetical protein